MWGAAWGPREKLALEVKKAHLGYRAKSASGQRYKNNLQLSYFPGCCGHCSGPRPTPLPRSGFPDSELGWVLLSARPLGDPESIQGDGTGGSDEAVGRESCREHSRSLGWEVGQMLVAEPTVGR